MTPKKYNQSTIDEIAKCGFLGNSDPEFNQFVEQLPIKYLAKYDLSAVRLGWEAYKRLIANVPRCNICNDTGINHGVQCAPSKVHPTGWKSEKCDCGGL
jgi:hypothetical protein